MSYGKFRKKPVVIEAIQLTQSLFDGIVGDYHGCEAELSELYYFEQGFEPIKYEGLPDGLMIPTLEGPMKASINDWIIRGVNGEYYPCKPDIFEKTYEEVI